MQGDQVVRIFGFDIGTTSIGSAVIQYDAARSVGEIPRLGVRIFPEARDPDGTPLNQQRRQKRMARRQLRRRKVRRRALNELLAEAGLLSPFGKGKHVNGRYEKSPWEEVMSLPPLALQKKGLEERLEPYELGRAIYHLAQRRHFKGREIEEGDQPEEETTDGKKAKSDREQTVQALKASGLTLGAWLAERAPKPGAKTSEGRVRGEVPVQRTRRIHALRSHVETEFESLWRAQAEHHVVLRDPSFRSRISDIIFAQRPVF